MTACDMLRLRDMCIAFAKRELAAIALENRFVLRVMEQQQRDTPAWRNAQVRFESLDNYAIMLTEATGRIDGWLTKLSLDPQQGMPPED